MSWIFITISAYFFGALANLTDKFMLGSKKVSSPIIYSFYVGIFGLGSFLLAPFGLHIPNYKIISICFLGGALFLFGITFLYFAIEKSEVGRAVPIFGAIIPVVSILLDYFFVNNYFSKSHLIGIIFLITGGLLISFNKNFLNNKKIFFDGFYFSITAGFLVSLAYAIFKYASYYENFITWYIWTRTGSFLSLGIFFIVPKWKKAIIKSVLSFKNKKNKNSRKSTIKLFLFGKISGGISTFLQNYAIGIGSIAIITSMVSIQYIFLLLLVLIFSKKNKKIFNEKMNYFVLIQKIIAIMIIAIGMFFIVS